MKIIVTSDLTIFGELRKLGQSRGFNVEKFIALNIKENRDTSEDDLTYIETANNVIFQSKNAVRYSKNLHKGLQKNKKAKIYCLGKYTKIELQKIFNNKIVHPDSKYSSESLLELIAKENINKENFMIIKGEGGRDYLENNLRDLGCNVKTVNTYRRVAKDSFLEEKVLAVNTNNYLLVSSKLALVELIKTIMSFAKNYNLILVAPNKRLSEGLNVNAFKDILIICNSSSADSYMNILEKHNEKK